MMSGANLLIPVVFLASIFVLLLSEVPHWEPLNIGIIGQQEMLHLSTPILDGLRSAVMHMESLINIWYFPGNDRLSAENLASCTPHWHSSTAQCFIQTTNRWEKFDLTLIDRRDISLKLYGVNFLLFLQVDDQKCNADDGLLAAAAPCALIGNNRPTAGQLIFCPLNHRWNSFRAIIDLFRHEIMHALGFGLITPEEDLSSTPTSRKFCWTDESSTQRVTATYMDFQDKAVIEARNHFGCENLHGVEADGDDKIHLNEYIYGDELMTPMLSNGRNYLTKISASILEATKNGEKQWYKLNESLVLAETKAYWYGRNWGCVFAETSCYQYIITRLSRRSITFPFCDANDLLKQYFETKHVCFSNGTATVMVPMTCNILSKVRITKIALGLQARTLAHHFKILSRTRLRNFYGSDGTHRYCPFVKILLAMTIYNTGSAVRSNGNDP
uniref:Leishmanolysin-like peptidase n=1 Tax=Setaria digitata TaxID=48799 RepID=A0A915Q413_9BILA